MPVRLASLVGVRNANFLVYDNGPGNPQVLLLTGTKPVAFSSTRGSLHANTTAVDVSESATLCGLVDRFEIPKSVA